MGGLPRNGAPVGMTFDLLLEWMSERGSGSLELFADAFRWLAPEGPDETHHRVLADFSSLGYVEVDWAGRKWEAAPTCIMLVSNSAGHALLCGGRTGRLRAELPKRIGDLATIEEIDVERAPCSIFISAAQERALEEAAARLGVPYVSEVPETLTDVLPPIDDMLADYEVSGPPTRHFGVRRWTELAPEGDDRHKRSTWTAVEDDIAPGLYRYDVDGPRTHDLVRPDGSRARVDYATGIWGRMKDASLTEEVIWWHHDWLTASFPIELPLPPLHARALTLCTGLPPKQNRHRTHWQYFNVPRKLAHRVADALGQSLAFED